MFEAINKRLVADVEKEVQTKDEFKNQLKLHSHSNSTHSALCMSSEHSEGLEVLELENDDVESLKEIEESNVVKSTQYQTQVIQSSRTTTQTKVIKSSQTKTQVVQSNTLTSS